MCTYTYYMCVYISTQLYCIYICVYIYINPGYIVFHLNNCREQELRLWQSSWGRRLGICKGGIEPQESPWKFWSIYPQNQSLPTFCFVLSPTPPTLWGAVPHYLSEKRVSLQLQLIKFLGVTVFQPTNSFGSPLACLIKFFPATCDCSEPPNCERQEMF